MRTMPLALIAGLCLFSAAAHAGVRGASLGVDNDAALTVLRFDGQPQSAVVHSRDGTVEIIVRGVQAAPSHIFPADAHILRTIAITPAADGLHLVLRFHQPPLHSTVRVYDHAVLVRARFDHALRAQTPALHFGHGAPSVQVAKKAALARPVQVAKTDSHGAPPPPASQSRAATAQHRDLPPASTRSSGRDTPQGTVHGERMVRQVTAERAMPAPSAEACAAAKTAVKDDPWALDKLSLYGDCIAREGKTDEAKEVFARLLTFNPEMVSAYVGLGAIARKKGDLKAARIYYEKARDLGGSDAEASRIRATLAALEPAKQAR